MASTTTVEQQQKATPPPKRRVGRLKQQNLAGWVFVAPAVVIIGLFLVGPIFMAAYVSLTSWNGLGSPFTGGNAQFVGMDNFQALLTEQGLARSDFATSLRNTFYYVLFVVPSQTVLALTLALVVNQRFLKGRGFFRTAFYFPSVTSSIAIAVVFTFLFQNRGVVNTVLATIGITGPAWFSDARGLFQIILNNLGIVDINNPPAWMLDTTWFNLSLWEWFSGPSVAMMTIIILVSWTTAGTFMLMFIAALQDISGEVEEASMVDGASAWQRLRFVTIPMLKPTLFLVITLGLIGTWQVFDQVYVMSQGAPAKTTLTPAFLSYQTSFRDFNYGSGAALAFLLFGIIILMTLIQRWIMRDKDAIRERKANRARKKAERAAQAQSMAQGGAGSAGDGGAGVTR